MRETYGPIGVVHEDKRDHQGESRDEHPDKYTKSTQPLFLAHSRSRGRLGELNQFLSDGFVLRRSEGGRHHRWQRGGNHPVHILRSRGLSQGSQRADAASLLPEATYQVEDAINDSPGDVAAERTDEHRPNVSPILLSNAERA